MPRTTVPLLAALLVFALPPASARAQDADSRAAAERLVDRYRIALAGGEWTAAGDLVHPDDLADFRDVVRSLADHEEGPAMLAEWFDDPSALESLSDAALLGAYLEWLMAGEPGAMAMLRLATWQIDDVTIDGASAVVASVVTIPTEADTLRMPDTTELRRYEGEWRIDLSAAVAALRESLAGEPR